MRKLSELFKVNAGGGIILVLLSVGAALFSTACSESEWNQKELVTVSLWSESETGSGSTAVVDVITYNAEKYTVNDLSYTFDPEKVIETLHETYGISFVTELYQNVSKTYSDDGMEYEITFSDPITSATEIKFRNYNDGGNAYGLQVFAKVPAESEIPEQTSIYCYDANFIEYPSELHGSYLLPKKYSSQILSGICADMLGLNDYEAGKVYDDEGEEISLVEGVTDLQGKLYINVCSTMSFDELGRNWVYVLEFEDLDLAKSLINGENTENNPSYGSYVANVSSKGIKASKFKKEINTPGNFEASALYKINVTRDGKGDFTLELTDTEYSDSEKVSAFSYVLAIGTFVN